MSGGVMFVCHFNPPKNLGIPHHHHRHPLECNSPTEISSKTSLQNIDPPTPIVKYRFGFSSTGFERIKEIFRKENMITEKRDEYFIDEYIDLVSMVHENTWKKKRVFMKKGLEGDAWEHSAESPPLSIVKSEVKVSGEDTMQYNELRKAWEEGKDVVKDPVTEIHVHRQVFKGKGFKIVVDRATFPDGDPHCTAALEWDDRADIHKLLEAIRKYSVHPIRSKIIEYMHRYDMKDILAALIQDKKIPDLKYRKSTLSDQWQSIRMDKFYNAWKREMGTVGAPVAESITKEKIEFMRKIEDDDKKFDFEKPDDEYDENDSDDDSDDDGVDGLSSY